MCVGCVSVYVYVCVYSGIFYFCFKMSVQFHSCLCKNKFLKGLLPKFNNLAIVLEFFNSVASLLSRNILGLFSNFDGPVN